MLIGKNIEIYSYTHPWSNPRIENLSKDDFYGHGSLFRVDVSFGWFSVVFRIINHKVEQ
jgi:hypothetical protein